MAFGVIIQAMAILLSTLFVVKIIRFYWREWTSPLHILPGPPSKSWIFGNMKEMWEGQHCDLEESWLESYGSDAVRYKGFIGMNQLFTTDLTSIQHILSHSDDYQKPPAALRSLERIVGPGLLVVEGDTHRRQRKAMNPAFGTSSIREVMPVFIEKATELRDIWATEILESGAASVRIDVMPWMSRTTLDIIGLAGFHYTFDALSSPQSGKTNELHSAFTTIFETGMKITAMAVLRTRIPLLQHIPSARARKFDSASATMKRIGYGLLEESKALLKADGSVSSGAGSVKGRDLLSVLVRANIASDEKENQRLSDEEVVAQIATSLVAGHETSSTAMTWALFALAKHGSIQAKLRAELQTLQTDEPSMETLNSLPYLDACVRESLRLYTPIPSKVRVATKDNVLPVGEGVKDREGKSLAGKGIPIRKGQLVFIPIMSINRKKNVWGDDAREFRPERWETFKSSEDSAPVPGVWGSILSFLGGPRSCIGYRFSILEMKSVLFTLIRTFEFSLSVPEEDVTMTATIVLRPSVKSQPEKGNQMPLVVKFARS